MFGALTQDTISRVLDPFSAMGVRSPVLRKTGTAAGFTTALGLVEFDLERVAKLLYPALSPIRNEIPRVGNTGLGFGTAAHWRALTNINTTEVFPGVAEGKRGGQISFAEVDYTATYKGLGLEDYVTFEGEYAAYGFDDILQTATFTLLQAMMVEEEKALLWGNTSFAVGGGSATPTPTVVDNSTSSGGGFGTTPFVFCVALTPLGLLLAGGQLAPTTADVHLTNFVVDQVSRTNADGTSDTINGGHAIISAQGSATITSGHTVTASVTGVAGAAGYAWYAGSTTGAANCKLAAVTAIPTVVLTGPGNAANQAANFTGSGSDRTTNSLIFDGLTTQLLTASGWGSGGIFNQMGLLSPAPGAGYVKSLAGATLTASGNAINEIDTALQWMWDVYRLWPDEIWVPGRLAAKITNIAMASSAPVTHINVTTGGAQGAVTAGSLVTQYINKFAMGGAKELPIRIHPYMPDGWIFGNIKTIGDKYPTARIGTPARVKARREYYSVAWPVTTRQRQYGVYVDEVLEHYLPTGMFLIQDVG